MEILWWLAPPVAATVLAMLWVSWLGRAGRGEVDREVAVRRLGAALARPVRSARPTPRGTPSRAAPGERSTGVALRRSPSPSQSTAMPAARAPGLAPESDDGRQSRVHPARRPPAQPPGPEAEPGRSTRRAS